MLVIWFDFESYVLQISTYSCGSLVFEKMILIFGLGLRFTEVTNERTNERFLFIGFNWFIYMFN